MPKTSTRVLVIDDDDSIRSGCAHILAEEGYLVRVAEDGNEGLSTFKSWLPEIVLLDIRMPGPDGISVIPEMLAVRPQTIVIVITGYATVEHAVRSMKSGAFDFLSKPFSSGDLRTVVARGVDKIRMIEEVERLRSEKKRLTDFFTSIVSHQLRSPIAAVSQYFEVLLNDMAGELPAEAKKIVQRAGTRLQELMELIADWLSLAKLDSEKLKEDAGPVDLPEIIRNQIELHLKQIKEKRILVEVHADDGSAVIEGNRLSLQEVISNLLSNAIKYNKDSGQIVISVERQDQSCVIRFRDTGIGVPAKHLPFLFNEFYRVKDDLSREIPGTGLGLTIVKKIVEAHGGSVAIESQEGQGSIFVVTLPLHQKKKGYLDDQDEKKDLACR